MMGLVHGQWTRRGEKLGEEALVCVDLDEEALDGRRTRGKRCAKNFPLLISET